MAPEHAELRLRVGLVSAAAEQTQSRLGRAGMVWSRVFFAPHQPQHHNNSDSDGHGSAAMRAARAVAALDMDFGRSEPGGVARPAAESV